MMTLHFPLSFTWAHLAKMRGAGDAFDWDESMLEADDPDTTLEGQIACYSEAFVSSPKLAKYLEQIGYSLLTGAMKDGKLTFAGIEIRSEVALRTANQLFGQIMHEYDEPGCPRTEVHRHGCAWFSTPTWALFELGGDDDVDYCGTQPSCLTALLIDHLEN